MGLIGKTALAAHSIAVQIASVTFMVPMGFGQAVTVRVGRAFGAGDPEAMRRAGWTAFVIGEGFMALTAALMLFAPNLLISAFLDRTNPASLPVVDDGRLVGIIVTAQLARRGNAKEVGETIKGISEAKSGRGSHARG